MKFILQPYKHQLDALEHCKTTDCFGFFWEQGTGKTKGVIEVMRYLFNTHKRKMRVLILTPSAAVYNWKDEILKNSRLQDSDVVLLNQKTSKAKLKEMEKWLSEGVVLKGSKIVVTNYETLQNKEVFAAMEEWKPEILIADESHYCKNPTAKRTKNTMKIARKAKYRYIMTGTPLLKNIEDVFSQFMIMDHGETFGKSFRVFKSKYMYDANAGWAGNTNYFPNWQAREDMYGELHEKIYQKAMRVLKKDCLDLPDFVEETDFVYLSKEQEKYYKEMSRDLLTYVEEAEKGGEKKAVVASIAVVKALRLQQIVSGFLKTESGETIHIKGNPKADRTKELLLQLTPDHKVIVWCSFKENYKTIEEICKSIGVEYGMITGQQNAKEKRASEQAFQKDDNVRVLIANRRAGGIAINLTAASYSIVYSRNFSLGEELQSDARNHRGGSEIHDKITKINLTAKGTIDEDSLLAIQNKQDISKRVIDFVKQSIGG